MSIVLVVILVLLRLLNDMYVYFVSLHKLIQRKIEGIRNIHQQ